MSRLRCAIVLLTLALAGRAAELDACSGCLEPSFKGGARLVPSDLNDAPTVQGDFNEDGNLDIVMVGGPYPTAITFFAGTRSGRFQPAVTTQLSFNAYFFDAVAGDFDGDGHLDLVVENFDSFQPEIYFVRGVGNGTFFAPVATSVPFLPARIVAGDFDGDGNLDVATIPIPNYGDSVTIEFGDGKGGFGEPRSVFVSNEIAGLASADFNGDGRTDLVVTHTGTTFSVVLGGPRDAIGPATEHSYGANFVQSVATLDFNGDGKVDLAFAAGLDGIILLAGVGNGNFVLSGSLPFLTSGLIAADFNGDGRADLFSFGPASHLLLGDGSGSFADAQSTAEDIVSSAVAGDFNRDGMADLAITRLGLLTFLSGGGAPFLLPSSGSPPPRFYPGGIGSTVVADFNGDGINDLAMLAYEGIHVTLGNGFGGYGPPITTPITDLRFGSALPADVNGDGRMDLLVLDGSALAVLLGDGFGSFSPAVWYAVGGGGPMAVGDFDRDGHLDVAVVSDFERETILFGDGTGGFRSFALINDGIGSVATAMAAGDFNGDGKLDLAVATGGSPAKVRILLGTGTGSFTQGSLTLLPPSILDVRALIAADFNQDGTLDLALSGQGVWVLANDGAGNLISQQRYGPVTPERLGLADLDGNGLPDILLLQIDSSLRSVLYNTNCEARHLEVVEGSSCNVAGAPFAVQPLVYVADDGGTVVACDSGLVTASLLSGPPGAVLGGTHTVAMSLGVALFTNLSVSLPGSGYRIGFSHPVAGNARSLPFTAGLTVSIGGPTQACAGTAAVFSAGAGYDTYVWEVDGVVAGSTRPTLSVTGWSAGPHTVAVTVKKDRCSVSTSKNVTVLAGPSAAVSAPAGVCPFSSGHTASVPDAGAGASYGWTVDNGVITAGQGTRTITFKSGPYGQAVVTATVTDGQGCSATGQQSVAIDASLSCPGPEGFFTVPPCRLVDTRGADGPALSAGSERTFGIVGRCGIPATATAVSVNVTVTQPGAAGFVLVRAGSTPKPLASLVNYRAGQTRANNAILSLGAAGDLSASCGQPSGSTHLVIDVNGYFQ